jgi:hypothetical protein
MAQPCRWHLFGCHREAGSERSANLLGAYLIGGCIVMSAKGSPAVKHPKIIKEK